MKLPWKKEYLVIGFHAAVTFAVIYALKLLLDCAAYIVTSLPDVSKGVGAFFSWTYAVLSPLFIGLIIAYLFDPLVDFFQKRYEWLVENKLPMLKPKKKPKKQPRFARRTAGAIFTYLTALLILAALIGWTARKLKVQEDLFPALAEAVDRSRNQLSETYAGLQIRLQESGLSQLFSDYLNQIINTVTLFLQNLVSSFLSSLSSVLTSLSSAGNSIINFLFGLIVAFYLMSSKEALLHGVRDIISVFLPARLSDKLRGVAGDVNHILSGYIRGILTDAVIMSCLVSILLSILNVNFAIVIGVFTGFSNIIPYFGAFIGLALAGIAAFLSGGAMTAVYALVGIIILQQIDGLFINPRIVGKNVELSPLSVILALSAAGSIFGVGGLILAVPVCAVAKLFLTRFIAYKKKQKAARRADHSESMPVQF